MSDQLDELLASYSFDTETVWQDYKNAFQRRSPQDRDAQLQGFDKFCADNDKMTTLSRETAELLNRKRELLDMHGMLRRLGR
jgi:hypothetical protein